jgi:hypothetical protein
MSYVTGSLWKYMECHIAFQSDNHHARFTHQLADIKQPDAASSELLLGTVASPLVQLPDPAEDPMRLEAELACSQQEVSHGKLAQCRPTEQIEVKRIEVKLVEAPEWEYNQAAHEPPEDRQSPLSLRSKAEQFTGINRSKP